MGGGVICLIPIITADLYIIRVWGRWGGAFIAHLLHLSTNKKYTVIPEDYLVQKSTTALNMVTFIRPGNGVSVSYSRPRTTDAAPRCECSQWSSILRQQHDEGDWIPLWVCAARRCWNLGERKFQLLLMGRDDGAQLCEWEGNEVATCSGCLGGQRWV